MLTIFFYNFVFVIQNVKTQTQKKRYAETTKQDYRKRANKIFQKPRNIYNCLPPVENMLINMLHR